MPRYYLWGAGTTIFAQDILPCNYGQELIGYFLTVKALRKLNNFLYQKKVLNFVNQISKPEDMNPLQKK